MKSLKTQAEELKLTREELEKSTEAQKQSSIIFKQQQFETTFFSLLGHLDLSISEAFNHEKRQYNDLVLGGLGRIHIKYNELNGCEKIEKIINVLNLEISEIRKNHMDRFYSLVILIIELLSFVDKNDLSKEMYIGLFKAKLNRDVLQILFFSLLNNDTPYISKGKVLVEKYSVFENMDFFYSNKRKVIIFLFYLLKDEYSENAFLNNSSFEKIPAENEFSEFKRAYYNHAN